MASLFHHLRRWFAPHTSNNYRALLLHNGSLVIAIGIILGTSALIRIVESSPLQILGFTSSVTVDEVVSYTNRERLAAGLAPLSYSGTLSDAARLKAQNMFEENYWAHNAPSGKSPWVWFNQVGYKYTFAGENLAKDFGSTDRMVDAWMNSPTHRANIVSDKYQEMGVAVVPGSILGGETVLVVQLFGATSKLVGDVPAEVNGAETQASPVEPATIMEVRAKATLDQYLVKKVLGISMAVLFLLALVIDLVIAESSKLSRRVGKNWGHIIVINVMLLLVTIAHAGSIL